MVCVKVLYFAVARERLKMSEERVELSDGATVRTLWSELKARHAGLGALEAVLKFAVNERFVREDESLRDGDEVALIPPVAGGAGEGPHVRISDEAIEVGEVLAHVSGDERGGIVTFSGMVRRHSRGKEIERLEYEAYRPMAERELAKIARDVQAKWPQTCVAVVHRVGVLAVGEIAVVIAVSAPHRKEAFAACEAMIDRLKESVPIWKKEIATDGESWVGLGP